METNTEVNTFVVGNTNTTTNNKHRNRNWFITLNNPQIADYERLKRIGNNELVGVSCKYLIYQVEKVDTIHLHACLVFANPRQWPKDIFPEAHIEAVKNLNACIRYCSKDETRIDGPYEYGVRPEQGRRRDLEELAREIMETGDVNAIMQERPDVYVRYHRGLQGVAQARLLPRTSKPTILWLWGLSGVGKTRLATAIGRNYYIKDGTQWWDNYKQEPSIIIDDFDGRWPYRDLLRLLDRYPYQGQVKGGYVHINSDYIIITCEHHPQEYWSGNEYDQVNRRLDLVWHCTDLDRDYDYVNTWIYHYYMEHEVDEV